MCSQIGVIAPNRRDVAFLWIDNYSRTTLFTSELYVRSFVRSVDFVRNTTKFIFSEQRTVGMCME